MSFTPQIDGAIPARYERLSHAQAAAGFINGVRAAGWLLHESNQNLPRIASWVESPNEHFGYALGLSRPELVVQPEEEIELPEGLEPYEPAEDLGHLSIKAIFFKVDRNLPRDIVDQKSLEVRTDTDATTELDQALETFDTRDMKLTLSMMQKIRESMLKRKKRNNVDLDVAIGLALSHVDTLANMFPGTGFGKQP